MQLKQEYEYQKKHINIQMTHQRLDHDRVVEPERKAGANIITI